MSEQDFEHIQLPRPGPPDLGISFLKPKDWMLLKLPDDPPTFDKPTYLMPLAIAMAPFGAVLFTVAVRPAYDDGSVRDWAQYLCRENNVQITAGQDTTLCGFEGCLVEGQQPSEMGLMKMRMFFFEDGRRLFQLNTVGPEQIWPSVEQQLTFIARSFRTDATVGQTAPIAPPKVEEPVVQSTEPGPEVVQYHDASIEEPTVIATVALADDAASLAEDHPMNARLRDNGVGLVPRILDVKTDEKYAVLAAGAVGATFKLPLGWHCVDDGKRTLIFDAGGKMQINLDRRQVISIENAIDAIIDEYTTQQPDVQHVKLEMYGMQCVGFRNFRVDGEVLDQVFMFKPTQERNDAFVARVTADGDNISFATNTAEVVMREIDETRTARQPWQVEVDRLVKLGKLEEAETLLRKSIDHLGVYSSIAHLWEQECARLAEAGDIDGARKAARRAADNLYSYAAGATSGGEGAALSHERDQRLAALKAYL